MTQSFVFTLSFFKGHTIKDADLRITLAHMLAQYHNTRNTDLKRVRENGYSYAISEFYKDLFLGKCTGLYEAFSMFQAMRDRERKYKRNKRASRARQAKLAREIELYQLGGAQ